jgi:glyoxylate reductase
MHGILKGYFDLIALSDIQKNQFSHDDFMHVKGLICMVNDTIDKEVIDLFPNLKIISNTAIGFNNINYQYASSKDIFLATIDSKTMVNSVVEFTFSLILSFSRKIREADQYIRKEKFKKWSMDIFVGNEVNGKVMGIVGFGNMGKALVPVTLSFGMKVIYNNKNGPINSPFNSDVKYADLDNLLKNSDFIVLLLPLDDSTKHLIDMRELKLMKKSAVLINMARGAIIKEKSLVYALQNGIIGGACLDVYEFEPKVPKSLINLDNTLLSPHIGSATKTARNEMQINSVKNLVDFFA